MLALDALERAEGGEGISRIERSHDGEGAALRLRDLSVTLDDGTAVVEEAEVAIMPGERVLIVGDSGSGKSTLIRAIAGLWPWGEGKIEVRKDAKIIFLPQRPYVPIGSLRRAATYPEPAESRTAGKSCSSGDAAERGLSATSISKRTQARAGCSADGSNAARPRFRDETTNRFQIDEMTMPKLFSQHAPDVGTFDTNHCYVGDVERAPRYLRRRFMWIVSC
jgi:energy-coupling factor transporter ATP-binding protein EcfA2